MTRNITRLFFTNMIDIVSQCCFELPNIKNWRGHPFYFDCLKTIQNLNKNLPKTINELMSVPLWHNKYIKSKFDCELSRCGFNFIKDLVFEGKFLELERLSHIDISRNKKKKILNFGELISPYVKHIINQNASLFVIPYPQTVLKSGHYLKDSNSRTLYEIFIEEKSKTPTGMLRWNQNYLLSDNQIKNAFVFAHNCTLSTKSRTFQYKISTYILPTKEYLWNYKVKDNYYCDRCLSDNSGPRLERDNIKHSLFSCPLINPFLENTLNFS